MANVAKQNLEIFPFKPGYCRRLQFYDAKDALFCRL